VFLIVIKASFIDKSSYGSYLVDVKTVGVKVLKNNLSKYLKLVRRGETVLVTDRLEVIAEIRRPQAAAVEDRLQAFLEDEARQGRVILATANDPNALDGLKALPRLPRRVNVQKLLDEIRADRDPLL